jgi:4'-phosphopantetheinyl transferase
MRLADGEAHVWLVSLDVPSARRAELEGTLSPDERERADRYRSGGARERFVVARGTLREVLGEYCGLAPERLRFSYQCACGREGCEPSQRKPRLDPEDLRFNVSHTDGLAVIAVARDAEVGIDIERVRPDTDVEAIAERILGHALRELPEAERPGAFYRDWTRREARGKARGDGIAPVDGDGTRWWVSEVAAPEGYVAALALEGGKRAVRTAWWPE